MGNGLLAEWRRGILARGLAGAALVAVPVVTAAAIGFGTSLSGVTGGLSEFASGPAEPANPAPVVPATRGIDRTLISLSGAPADTGGGAGGGGDTGAGGGDRGGGDVVESPGSTGGGGGNQTGNTGGGSGLPDVTLPGGGGGGGGVGGIGGGGGSGDPVGEIINGTPAGGLLP